MGQNLIPQAPSFTAMSGATAADKLKFYAHFQRFVESDFAKERFPEWFYNRLRQTFGHIAHYDREGFYNTFFRTTAGKLEFVEGTLQYRCYGDPAFTYSDVERELIGWLNERGTRTALRAHLNAEILAAERRQLAALKNKFEPRPSVPMLADALRQLLGDEGLALSDGEFESFTADVQQYASQRASAVARPEVGAVVVAAGTLPERAVPAVVTV
jgi:hypothetical protein